MVKTINKINKSTNKLIVTKSNKLCERNKYGQRLKKKTKRDLSVGGQGGTL